MSRYGEPWKTERINHVSCSECEHIDLILSDGMIVCWEGSLRTGERAVACVNAMEGLDPKKVREVIDWLDGEEQVCGCQMLDDSEKPCLACRIKACKEEP